ncbi:unnamed protein product [Spirodela intermedia]|uniref:Uncharacterized protein n=1 Tax=Spirodela intermedia TaxID=51605 RepID=A0A7I8KRS0_SPIIN|nr:unnamed protein product [Spirodela intermedia]
MGKRGSTEGILSAILSFIGCSRGMEEKDEDEPRRKARVWASDEDCGWWVGEPDIDIKAAAYIARMKAQLS